MLEVRFPKQMIYLFLSLTNIMTNMKRFWDLVTFKKASKYKDSNQYRLSYFIKKLPLSKKVPIWVFFHMFYMQKDTIRITSKSFVTHEIAN